MNAFEINNLITDALSFSSLLWNIDYGQNYVEEMKKILMEDNWKVRTSICWGQRDRWLDFDGVEDFCKAAKLRLVELPMVLTFFKRIPSSNIRGGVMGGSDG